MIFIIIICIIIFVIYFGILEKKSINKHKKNQEYYLDLDEITDEINKKSPKGK